MRKRYIGIIFVTLLISSGAAFKILETNNSSFKANDNTIDQHQDNSINEPENETINEPENETINEPENETNIEPIFLPKFHIYGFKFYGMHISGGTYGGSAYVSFFIQNLGNGTATIVSVAFVVDFTDFDEHQHYFHMTKIIVELEPKETQYYEVDADEFHGYSHWNFNSATANISCAENVTEVFNFSSP